MNIEPGQIIAGTEDDSPYDEGDEFNDRLQVLGANISNRMYFPTPCTINLGDWRQHGVALSEFASFALTAAKWRIPEELAALSKPGVENRKAIGPPTSASVQADSGDDGPPGKSPKTAIGRLAVEAAWAIERELKRRATDREVMGRLQDWADSGSQPDILKKSDREKRAVIWLTSRYEAKSYSLEACQKTLQNWNSSRRQKETGQTLGLPGVP